MSYDFALLRPLSNKWMTNFIFKSFFIVIVKWDCWAWVITESLTVFGLQGGLSQFLFFTLKCRSRECWSTLCLFVKQNLIVGRRFKLRASLVSDCKGIYLNFCFWDEGLTLSSNHASLYSYRQMKLLGVGFNWEPH